MIIKAKNSKQANKKIEEINEERKNIEAKKDIIELVTMSTRDLLSITGFFKYLIDKRKNKSYMTPKDSIVYKHKKTLERLHKCKIIGWEKG